MVTTAEPIILTPKLTQRGAFDAYGRQMTYLRISLTDRCNFRCVYCMPASGMVFQPREELLSDEELIRLIGIFAKVGFKKIRLTGGEPTIRPHLIDIVREIKKQPGIEELSMTTNALILGRIARDLKDAGLDRVNVSFDTLDPVKFRMMTRGGRFDLVWAGLEAAQEVGLTPIKINSVVLRGHNDHEVGDLAALTLDRPDGVTKLVLHPQSGHILGVGIVGPGAGELISEAVLAIEMGATAEDLKLTIHPHPTLSETLMEAAEVFFGQSTHIYRPKRA